MFKPLEKIKINGKEVFKIFHYDLEAHFINPDKHHSVSSGPYKRAFSAVREGFRGKQIDNLRKVGTQEVISKHSNTKIVAKRLMHVYDIDIELKPRKTQAQLAHRVASLEKQLEKQYKNLIQNHKHTTAQLKAQKQTLKIQQQLYERYKMQYDIGKLPLEEIQRLQQRMLSTQLQTHRLEYDLKIIALELYALSGVVVDS